VTLPPETIVQRPRWSGRLRTARAVVGTVGIALVLPLLLLAGLMLMPLGDVLSGRHRLGYEIGRRIVWVLWFVGGIRMHEVGRHRVEPFRTRVYMPNHQSLTDMVQVLYLLPKANGTLIKKEAFRVPILGGAFRAAGFTPVDRSNPKAARASLEAAVQAMKSGRSFVIAPEGTRSRTGQLGPFKPGREPEAARFEGAERPAAAPAPMAYRAAGRLGPCALGDGDTAAAAAVEVVSSQPLGTSGLVVGAVHAAHCAQLVAGSAGAGVVVAVVAVPPEPPVEVVARQVAVAGEHLVHLGLAKSGRQGSFS